MAITYLVSIPLERDKAGFLADCLSELAQPAADAVAMSRLADNSGLWRIEAYYSQLPEDALAAVLRACDLPSGYLRALPLPEKDWVSQSLEGLSPVRTGRFFIHGSHDRPLHPRPAISLRIDAGTAFGTGHHGTTRGCLLALEHLHRRLRPRAVIDIGTGTGVLAMAAARLWKVPVIASDIDPVAISVARENARHNQAAPLIRFVTAPGARHPAIRAAAPCGLVMANILAGPLKRMSAALSALTAPGGHLILSGLLTSQEALLLAAFQAHGLRLSRRLRLAEWSTLILRRPGRS